MIKVFIVEDDPMVLEVNKGFLERLTFYQLVGTAENGHQALQRVKQLKPDLVLLDMYLPDISGLEVLSKIREERFPCDVIMITAARDAATVREVLRLGAIDYLVKPFRFVRFQYALEMYRKMWEKLNYQESLQQEDIDTWKRSGQLSTPYSSVKSLPKGLSEITLRQIMMHLLEQKKPVTAGEIGDALGMARVTVRRYLEYLEKEGKVRVDIQYGNIGRPSHYYSV